MKIFWEKLWIMVTGRIIGQYLPRMKQGDCLSCWGILREVHIERETKRELLAIYIRVG